MSDELKVLIFYPSPEHLGLVGIGKAHPVLNVEESGLALGLIVDGSVVPNSIEVADVEEAIFSSVIVYSRDSRSVVIHPPKSSFVVEMQIGQWLNYL